MAVTRPICISSIWMITTTGFSGNIWASNGVSLSVDVVNDILPYCRFYIYF
jgi:hypothetical protein